MTLRGVLLKIIVMTDEGEIWNLEEMRMRGVILTVQVESGRGAV
jgi:hypothetical protein